ncbi:periphilin-1 isoform X7 [Ochotona curzoniae]|uniref:periphilin-1 isoform X7 n=1 Tax=Ochotona curzoniae TaxID=130825 RepID=UPI001B35050B|nr:periphilin-1 isoform X7 [Ochotona curzoniae]
MMWSEGRYSHERPPRQRGPPRSHPADGYHRVVNIVPKKPPLLDRPGEGSYSRYYSHVDYRECDEDRSFSDRRSGPPHRGDDSAHRWNREEHSASRQSEYRERQSTKPLLPLPPEALRRQAPSFTRDVRDGFRRKSFHSSHYGRDRSPHKRDAPFLRDSPVGRKDSPHSRSGSSVSSRSYSPERSKTYSFHQSQHRSKERPAQSLKTSRDTSPSSSSAVPSSKAEPTAPEEPESSAPEGVEFFEDSQLSTRSKAIAMKTKEIEQVYRQDCETFGLVVKMLVEKDPSLAKAIQPALRQNLHELGERCVGELKRFIAEYDTATPALGEPL